MEKTVSQSNSDLWYKLRRNRLRASNFGKICRQRPSTCPTGLAYRLLYPSVKQTAEMKYGLETESIAREKYIEHTGNQVTLTGLIIDTTNGWLACTPDGLVNDDGEMGLIEIKCIAAKDFMNESIEKYVTYCKKSFLIKNENGTIQLKTTHHFYYQIQGQLHITGRSFCDLVVYTTKDLLIERIYSDQGFWDQEMFRRLYRFYVIAYVPEILLKKSIEKKPLVRIPDQFISEIPKI